MTAPGHPANAIAWFTDDAQKAGLSNKITFGGVDTKKYIIETTGTGVAIFDYDNDGWPDIFFVNGTTLDPVAKAGNPRQATSTTTITTARLPTSPKKLACIIGLGTGRLRRRLRQRRLTKIFSSPTTERTVCTTTTAMALSPKSATKAGVAGKGKAWGTGCAFVDYDRDGKLDLFVANYVDFDVNTAPMPGDGLTCMWKGVPVMCGPRGLAWRTNLLYHNRGDGTFEDVTQESAHR